MKIKNVILCASLLLLAAGCNKGGDNGNSNGEAGTPTVANTNAPMATNTTGGPTGATTTPNH